MHKHIIFDCDGVILDTEIVAAEVMSLWLQKQGVAIDQSEFIRAHTGKTFSGIIRELQTLDQLSTHLNIKAAAHEIEQGVKQNIRLVQGVEKMLLQNDTPKSIVSNSSSEYVSKAMTQFSLAGHFQGGIFSSQMVASPKPSPLVYELAVEKIDLPKEDILVIEDSRTGVQAAVGAGLRVVGFLGGSHILPGHADRLLEAGALTTVADFEALTALL